MQIDFSNRDLYNYKYIPLLHNKKRYVFLMWWSWSGKSVFVTQKEIIKSFERTDKTLCIRKVKDTLKDSSYAELKARISEWELDQFFIINKSPLCIKNKLSWHEFIFRWVDDAEKLKSVQWIGRIWIEEATELTKNDFDQIDLRLRGKQDMQITCSFNPTDAEHWLNTDFWINQDNENQTCLHSTYLDNRFVWTEYKAVMDRLVETNYNYYKIYALWEWWVLQWLIFEKWNIIQWVPKEANFLWYGQDFWYTNDPTAMVWLYLYNNEIILDEVIFEKGLSNVYKDEMFKNKSIVWQYEILNINKKDEIFADSSEPKSIEEIHREWYNIKPVEKWPDSIIFWLDIMLQYKINVTSTSANLQKEFKKYVWATDKNGKPTNKPIDVFNHAIDASRYVSMMKLKKQLPKKKLMISTC